MKYIFIYNGREDKAFVIDEVEKQLEETGLDAEKYITTEIGDATRYVNIFCDLNPKEEVCFVACGGAGLTLEVVSGLVNRDNKYLAILQYAGSNDIVKAFPGRNFQSVEDLLKGTGTSMDILKLNDWYALNTASLGMDAMVCALAQLYAYNGEKDYYNKGLRTAVLLCRLHRLDITIDGEPVKWKFIQNGQISNGNYTGGEFLCAPDAKVDDGLMNICLFRPMPLLLFYHVLKYFRKGQHLTNKFCRHFLISKTARHMEIRSRNDLISVGIDGETFAASSINVDVLEKAVKIILPPLTDKTE